MTHDISDACRSCTSGFCLVSEVLRSRDVFDFSESNGVCRVLASVTSRGYGGYVAAHISALGIFKWHLSNYFGYDIGLRNGWHIWKENGYATRAAHLYREGMDGEALFKAVREREMVTDWQLW